jgi:hypothetical protein
MICADFLAGANLNHGNPETLLFSMTQFFRLLPKNQKQAFLGNVIEKGSRIGSAPKLAGYDMMLSRTRICDHKCCVGMDGAGRRGRGEPGGLRYYHHWLAALSA